MPAIAETHQPIVSDAVATVVRPQAATARSIRREKVEAALRSKPQRGRKRENLSDLERVELTRTRNREHAKSTRLRKKARYQELLDCEEKLKEVEEEDEFHESRRNCVLNFLKIREDNMRSALSKESGQGNESAVAKEKKLSLCDIVVSETGFLFDDCSQPCSDRDGVEQLKQFDQTFVSRVASLFGASMARSLQLNMKAGANSIALNEDNQGFAVVELVFAGHPGNHLVKGIYSFDFDPDSEKLTRVSWTTIDDALKITYQRLNGQTSHPSVVSLDPMACDVHGEKGSHFQGKNSERQPKGRDDECSGPGMSI